MGILGVGRIGRLHADNVIGMPDVRLKAVADPFLEAEEWRSRGIEASLDPGLVIDDDEIEAVLASTDDADFVYYNYGVTSARFGLASAWYAPSNNCWPVWPRA